MVAFYNQGDQNIYKNFQYVPQEKYRLGFTAPTTTPTAAPVSGGITNTNAFTNSGGDSFNSAGNAFGYGSQIEPVSYGSYGEPGYMGGLPGNVQQYGVGRQFEDPSASPIGETYSYKKTVPGFARIAAGFIPFGNTALNFLENRMNDNRDQPGNYSVAGLSEAQKGAYNQLAGQGMLFSGSSGLKTLTGKNFTGKGYMEGQMDLAKGFGFDTMTDEEIEDAINAQGLANQNKFNTKNKGFKYKQMLEASKMFKTNKAQQNELAAAAAAKDKAAALAAIQKQGRADYNPGIHGANNYGKDSKGNQSFDFGGGFGIGSDGGPVSNKTGEGRTGYFYGGRVNFKNGGLASIL